MGNRVSGGMLTAQEGDKFRGGYPSGYTSITTAFPFMASDENLTGYYDTDQPQYDHVDYPTQIPDYYPINASGMHMTGGDATPALLPDDSTIEELILHIKDTPTNLTHKVKADLLKRIGTAVKNIGVKVDMKDPDSIVASLKKHLPDPYTGTSIRADNKEMNKIAVQIAEILNDEFSIGNKPIVDVKNLTPKEIVTEVAKHIYGISCGMNTEFYKVYNILKTQQDRIDTMVKVSNEILDQTTSKALETATEPQTVKEITVLKESLESALTQIKAAANVIRTATGNLATSETEVVAELERLKGKYDQIVKYEAYDGDTYGDTLANLLSTIGNAAFMTATVKNSLDKVGMTLSEYKKYDDLYDLLDKLNKKMESMNPVKEAEKITDLMFHTNELAKFFGQRKRMEGGIKSMQKGDFNPGTLGGRFNGKVSPDSLLGGSNIRSGRSSPDSLLGGADNNNAIEQYTDQEIFGGATIDGAIPDPMIAATNRGKVERAKLALRNFVNKINRVINKFADLATDVAADIGKDPNIDYEVAADIVERMEVIDEIREPSTYLGMIGYYVDESYREKSTIYNDRLNGLITKLRSYPTSDSRIKTKFGEMAGTIEELIKQKDYFSDLVKTLFTGMPKFDVTTIITDIPNTIYSISLATNRLLHAIYISRLKQNMRENAPEIDLYKKRYPEMVSYAVGEKRRQLNQEESVILGDNDKEKFLGPNGKDVSNHNLNSILRQYVKNYDCYPTMKKYYEETLKPDNKDRMIFKEIVQEEYRAKNRLYKALESLDLLLSHFGKELVTTPDLVKELRKYLSDTKVYTKWFTDYTGNNLVKLFESMPSGFKNEYVDKNATANDNKCFTGGGVDKKDYEKFFKHIKLSIGTQDAYDIYKKLNPSAGSLDSYYREQKCFNNWNGNTHMSGACFDFLDNNKYNYDKYEKDVKDLHIEDDSLSKDKFDEVQKAVLSAAKTVARSINTGIDASNSGDALKYLDDLMEYFGLKEAPQHFGGGAPTDIPVSEMTEDMQKQKGVGPFEYAYSGLEKDLDKSFYYKSIYEKVPQKLLAYKQKLDSNTIRETGIGIGRAKSVSPVDKYQSLKRHVDEYYNNFQALKNIFHAFITLYNRLVQDKVKGLAVMSPSQIYYAILSYLKTSAVARKYYTALPIEFVTNYKTAVMGVVLPSYSDKTKDKDYFRSVYEDEDKQCSLAIKSVVGAILSASGLLFIESQPANVGVINAMRGITGGAVTSYEILEEFTPMPEIMTKGYEIYYYLPRIAEFYKNMFNELKTSKNPSNTTEKDYRLRGSNNTYLSLPKDMVGNFGKLMYLTIDKPGTNTKYNNAEVKTIIAELNKAYAQYANEKEPVRAVVKAFIREVNRRFSVVSDEDIRRKLYLYQSRLENNSLDEYIKMDKTGELPFDNQIPSDSDPRYLDSLSTPSDSVARQKPRLDDRLPNKTDEYKKSLASRLNLGGKSWLYDEDSQKVDNWLNLERVRSIHSYINESFDDVLIKPDGDFKLGYETFDLYKRGYYGKLMKNVGIRMETLSTNDDKFTLAAELVKGTIDTDSGDAYNNMLLTEVVVTPCATLYSNLEFLKAALKDMAIFEPVTFMEEYGSTTYNTNPNCTVVAEKIRTGLQKALNKAEVGGSDSAAEKFAEKYGVFENSTSSGDLNDKVDGISNYIPVFTQPLKEVDPKDPKFYTYVAFILIDKMHAINALGCGYKLDPRTNASTLAYRDTFERIFARKTSILEAFEATYGDTATFRHQFSPDDTTIDTATEYNNRLREYIIKNIINCLDQTSIMSTIIGSLVRLSSSLGNLVKVDINSKGINLDLSQLRSTVKSTIVDVKRYIEKLRPKVNKSVLARYENIDRDINTKDVTNPYCINYLDTEYTKIFDRYFSGGTRYDSLLTRINENNTTIYRSLLSANYNKTILGGGSIGTVSIQFYDTSSDNLRAYNYLGQLFMSSIMPSHQDLTPLNSNDITPSLSSSVWIGTGLGKTTATITITPNDFSPGIAPMSSENYFSNVSTLSGLSNESNITSLLPALNYGIKSMIECFYEPSSKKIYSGVINKILSTRIGACVDNLELSYPDMIEVTGIDAIRTRALAGNSDPSLTDKEDFIHYPIPKPSSLLTYSNALLLRHIYSTVDEKTKEQSYMYTSLSDIRSKGLLETYKVKLPLFRDYFEKLVYKCKMLRALLTRTTEAKKIFGEMIVPPTRIVATPGVTTSFTGGATSISLPPSEAKILYSMVKLPTSDSNSVTDSVPSTGIDEDADNIYNAKIMVDKLFKHYKDKFFTVLKSIPGSGSVNETDFAIDKAKEFERDAENENKLNAIKEYMEKHRSDFDYLVNEGRNINNVYTRFKNMALDIMYRYKNEHDVYNELIKIPKIVNLVKTIQDAFTNNELITDNTPMLWSYSYTLLNGNSGGVESPRSYLSTAIDAIDQLIVLNNNNKSIMPTLKNLKTELYKYAVLYSYIQDNSKHYTPAFLPSWPFVEKEYIEPDNISRRKYDTFISVILSVLDNKLNLETERITGGAQISSRLITSKEFNDISPGLKVTALAIADTDVYNKFLRDVSENSSSALPIYKYMGVEAKGIISDSEFYANYTSDNRLSYFISILNNIEETTIQMVKMCDSLIKEIPFESSYMDFSDTSLEMEKEKGLVKFAPLSLMTTFSGENSVSKNIKKLNSIVSTDDFKIQYAARSLLFTDLSKIINEKYFSSPLSILDMIQTSKSTVDIQKTNYLSTIKNLTQLTRFNYSMISYPTGIIRSGIYKSNEFYGGRRVNYGELLDPGAIFDNINKTMNVLNNHSKVTSIFNTPDLYDYYKDFIYYPAASSLCLLQGDSTPLVKGTNIKDLDYTKAIIKNLCKSQDNITVCTASEDRKKLLKVLDHYRTVIINKSNLPNATYIVLVLLALIKQIYNDLEINKNNNDITYQNTPECEEVKNLLDNIVDITKDIIIKVSSKVRDKEEIIDIILQDYINPGKVDKKFLLSGYFSVLLNIIETMDMSMFINYMARPLSILDLEVPLKSDNVIEVIYLILSLYIKNIAVDINTDKSTLDKNYMYKKLVSYTNVDFSPEDSKIPFDKSLTKFLGSKLVNNHTKPYGNLTNLVVQNQKGINLVYTSNCQIEKKYHELTEQSKRFSNYYMDIVNGTKSEITLMQKYIAVISYDNIKSQKTSLDRLYNLYLLYNLYNSTACGDIYINTKKVSLTGYRQQTEFANNQGMKRMWKNVLEDEQKNLTYSNTSAFLSLYYLLASIRLWEEISGNPPRGHGDNYWNAFKELIFSFTMELQDMSVSKGIKLEPNEQDTIYIILKFMRANIQVNGIKSLLTVTVSAATTTIQNTLQNHFKQDPSMSKLSNKIVKILVEADKLNSPNIIYIGNEVIKLDKYTELDKHFNRYGLPSLHSLPKEIERVFQDNDCLREALDEKVTLNDNMIKEIEKSLLSANSKCENTSVEIINSTNDIKSFNYLVGGGDKSLNDIFNLGTNIKLKTDAIYTFDNKFSSLDLMNIVRGTNIKESMLYIIDKTIKSKDKEQPDKSNKDRLHNAESVKIMIELNVNPINYYSLMRILPLSNIYNYSCSLDRLIYAQFNTTDVSMSNLYLYPDLTLTNMNEGLFKDMQINRAPLEQRINDSKINDKLVKTSFLKMIINPYCKVSEGMYGTPTNTTRGYYGPIGRIMRGADCLGMGTPKFISDQLLQKVLLNSVYLGSKVGTTGVKESIGAYLPQSLKVSGGNNILQAQALPLTQQIEYDTPYGNLGLGVRLDNTSPRNSVDDLFLNKLTYYDKETKKVTDIDLLSLYNNNATAVNKFREEGYDRFNTQIIRNAFFIGNLQRTLRYMMNMWLTKSYQLVDQGHRAVAASVTERRIGNNASGQDENYPDPTWI